MPGAGPALKIPHMGWNDLQIDAAGHPVLAGVSSGDHAYFVHSYYFRCADPAQVLAHVDYGVPIAAAIGRDNLFGAQFHPAKSQSVGPRLLSTSLQWRPRRFLLVNSCATSPTTQWCSPPTPPSNP